MSKQLIKNVFVSGISGGLIALLITGISLNYYSPDQTQKTQPDTDTNLSEILDGKDYVTQQDLVIDTVEKASPAVVSIVITKDVPVLEQYYEESGSPFDSMFFDQPGINFRVPRYRESGETEEKEIGGGSGFLVSSDGYIVTNKHVIVEEEVNYTVFSLDGEEYDAKVIAKDTLNDLAILKIEGEDFPYLEFGDSENLKSGQSVIAIGNPLLEFNNSVSVGVISGLSRNITAGSRFIGKTEYIEDVIQTDAAINPGNSGGPLLNIDGEVIGVNVAIASAQNIGFAIPANTIKSAVESVKEKGEIVRPYLGVRYIHITESLQQKNDLPVDYGVLVIKGETMEDLAVIPGSPADKAGIEENDIILEIDGEKLQDGRSLAKIIASKNIGDEIELKIMHDGEEKEVTATLEKRNQ
jgi:serine protease Do